MRWSDGVMRGRKVGRYVMVCLLGDILGVNVMGRWAISI